MNSNERRIDRPALLIKDVDAAEVAEHLAGHHGNRIMSDRSHG